MARSIRGINQKRERKRSKRSRKKEKPHPVIIPEFYIILRDVIRHQFRYRDTTTYDRVSREPLALMNKVWVTPVGDCAGSSEQSGVLEGARHRHMSILRRVAYCGNDRTS